LRERQELRLQTVTPAFVGTAEKNRAEWNGKGVRGELRWWFRAVAGGEIGVGAKDHATQVRRLEEDIFGATDASSKLRVMVTAAAQGANPVSDVPGERLNARQLAARWEKGGDALVQQRLQLSRTNPLGYLGYGPIEYKTGAGWKYERGRIEERADLTLKLQWNKVPSETASTIFTRALWCWINLGGIGARSRRGFGSLVEMKDNRPIVSQPDFEKQVAAIFKRPTADAAAWTHLTTASAVYISQKQFTKWSEAMEDAGAWLIAFRRRYGIATDERGETFQKRDYAWLKDTVSPAGVPDRAGFGLPLPFGKRKEQVVGWGDQTHGGRRASPLLIHIGLFEPSRYAVVFTHLPAQLIPTGEKLYFLNHGESVTNRQEKIVEVFLDDLAGKDLIRKIAV
jgi:CRISPR-associated protein Cmr1